MSTKKNQCPKCFALDPIIIEVKDPDTYDMNSTVKLECWDCSHIWDGKVTSKYFKEQKKNGFAR